MFTLTKDLCRAGGFGLWGRDISVFVVIVSAVGLTVCLVEEGWLSG